MAKNSQPEEFPQLGRLLLQWYRFSSTLNSRLPGWVASW